jgi:predicted Zn-dependent protease
MKRILVASTIVCFITSIFSPAWADSNCLICPDKKTKLKLPDLTKAEEEARMGNLFDLYVTENFVILKDDKLNKKVSQIVERITRVSEKPDTQYKVRIINDHLPTAFSFPGNIYVSTGLMDILTSEDELAAVLAAAISRTLDKYQYNAFKSDLRHKRGALIARFIVSAILLTAGAMVGVVVIVNPGSMVSAAQQPNIPQTAAKLPERKAVFNRMTVPLGSMTHASSVSIFHKEVYSGDHNDGYTYYNPNDSDSDSDSDEKKAIDKEKKTIESAVKYLKKAGYNPKALASVFESLLKMREIYYSKGYSSNLLIAQPNLEGRLEHASKTAEKYK